MYPYISDELLISGSISLLISKKLKQKKHMLNPLLIKLQRDNTECNSFTIPKILHNLKEFFCWYQTCLFVWQIYQLAVTYMSIRSIS